MNSAVMASKLELATIAWNTHVTNVSWKRIGFAIIARSISARTVLISQSVINVTLSIAANAMEEIIRWPLFANVVNSLAQVFTVETVIQ